ncbi:peptidoglycan bridge formation glycyltransferase FemA/FemB family protein [uncultured Methanobrevibacter sp.]|uniref:peptidoglycan bridge formation glycyltransferase FemA/FemB family protein n=1 Tax=uncultured Methanobrevibacter sp. TaxID=253161 RepID=UPI0026062E50
MEFTELTEKEYSSFVEKHDQESYMQTLDLKNFKEKNNIKCYLVGVKDKKKVVAATLMYSVGSFLKKKRFYSSRGFIIDYNNKGLLSFFVENIKKYIKSHNGMSITIDPNVIYRIRSSDGEIIDDKTNDTIIKNLKELGFTHYGFNNYFETMQVRWVYRLKLDKSYDELKNNFIKSTRKNIEATHNNGVKIRIGNVEDIKGLSKIFKETAERDEFNTKSYEYYKSMFECMPNNIKVYMAYIDPKSRLELTKNKLNEEEKNNDEINKKMQTDMVGNKLRNKKEISDNLITKYKEEIKETEEMIKNHPDGVDIGALISVKSGTDYISLSSGTLTNYKKYYPKYALYDAHITDAYKMGYKYVNFYGIAGDFNPKNKYYGIYEFKKGFNGNVVEYVGEFTLGIGLTYKLFTTLKKLKKLIKK